MLKALSDRNRLRIVMMLTRKELCVCEIQDILALSVSTVSKHLSILRDAGFILDEKVGKWVIYRLNRTNSEPALSQMMLLLSFSLSDDEQIKSDLEKVATVCRNNLCG